MPLGPWLLLILAHVRSAQRARDGRRFNGGARRGAGRKPRTDKAGAKLLAYAAALIPAHVPADVREEAAQQIACDLLARVVTRDELDRRRVRAYVRAAWGLRDRFRFRSLDAPTSPSDDRARGDLLAA